MSRIVKENERYLARVKASMDRERNYRAERQREKDEAREARQRDRDEEREARQRDRDEAKEQRNMHRDNQTQRNMKITQSNDRYSDMWIATTGLSVPQIINLILRGGDSGPLVNRLDLRIYNRYKNIPSFPLQYKTPLFPMEVRAWSIKKRAFQPLQIFSFHRKRGLPYL